jgi:hypothetical protein
MAHRPVGYDAMRRVAQKRHAQVTGSGLPKGGSIVDALNGAYARGAAEERSRWVQRYGQPQFPLPPPRPVVRPRRAAPPAEPQIIKDINAAYAREAARRRSSAWATGEPEFTILDSGCVVRRVPIPMLRPGQYPPEWLDD